MKKIPIVFKRLHLTGPANEVIDEVTPGCEWVLAGEGKATLKWDGTACMIQNGVLYARYDRKRRRATRITPGMPLEGYKPVPNGWIACQEPDEITGHWPGWVPVTWEPKYIYHLEAFHEPRAIRPLREGTCELVGPKVQGNPHEIERHILTPHGANVAYEQEGPRTFDSIRSSIEGHIHHEGIVFWHDDGRMAKIKRRDFGFDWPIKGDN